MVAVVNVGGTDSSVYAATKAALLNMTKALSTELLDRRIRFNVVSRVLIETPR